MSHEPDYRDETNGFIRAVAFVLVMVAAILAVSMCSAHGAECRVSWNPQADATSFRVWRGIELLATVATNQATVTVPDDQPSTLTVTAVNAAGESAQSEPLYLPAPDATLLTIERSTDLQTWAPIAELYDAKAPKVFYRLRITVKP